jgi:O-antigen/teichoic acid export membrane protein
VNTLFAPAISSLHAVGDKASMQLLVKRAATWTLAAGTFISIALFAFANPLMTWFSPEYADGIVALRVLLLSQVIAAGAGSQLYLMIMTGHERKAAGLLMLVTGVNLAAGVPLVHAFGLIGAAAGTTVALVGWNAAMGYFIWRKIELVPGVLSAGLGLTK